MAASGGSRRATVVARWSEKRVLVEIADGSTVSLEVGAEMEDRVDIGSELWVELVSDGSVASWSLADGN